jgi:hypothetical protein
MQKKKIQSIAHYIQEQHRQPGVKNAYIIVGITFQRFATLTSSLATERRVESRRD